MKIPRCDYYDRVLLRAFRADAFDDDERAEREVSDDLRHIESCPECAGLMAELEAEIGVHWDEWQAASWKELAERIAHEQTTLPTPISTDSSSADNVVKRLSTPMASLLSSPKPRSMHLAASMKKTPALPEDVVLFHLRIGNEEFAFLEDQDDGRVFVRGPIPSRATHLRFASRVSSLKSCNRNSMREVEGLGSIELERLLRSCDHPIVSFVIESADAK